MSTTADPIVVTESRKDAIAAALQSVGEQTETKEEKVETKVDDKPKDEKVAVPTNDETTKANELKEQNAAIELFRALNDKEKAPLVVDFLARQFGYSKADLKEAAKNEDKAEEIKDDIVKTLKESLGPEFDFLADKFGPAIEKIMDKKLADSQKDIRAQFEAQEREKVEAQSARTLSTLTEDFFGKDEKLPANVEAEMSKYMDKYKPGLDVTVKEYVEDAFSFAVGKLGLTKTDKAKQERTNKNRNDASSRLASARAPQEDNIHVDSSKPMSRKEAIQAALEKVANE